MGKGNALPAFMEPSESREIRVEDKWERLREIVREECEKVEARILDVLEKHTRKVRLGFANGKWTGITEEQIAAWKEAYGLCEVEAELKKAAAWIVSNPAQAPKSNHSRFLNAWLSRQQNALSIRSIPTRNDLLQDKKKFCAYCERPSVGSVGNIWHCGAHSHDAMDGVKPMKAA